MHQNYFYPNALHFQLTTPDELYDLYITVLKQSDTTITIELWCPQTELFNTEISINIEKDVISTINSFIHSHIESVGIECRIE